MDLGSFIQSRLNDFKNTVSSAAQGVGSWLNQPQVTSPVPQQQTMAPQVSPLQQIGNFANQQLQYGLQGKNAFGQQLPFSLNNPFAPAPRINVAQNINTGNPVTTLVARGAAAIPQSILNSPSDLQQAGKQTVQDIQSGQIRQPGTALRDAAQIAVPTLTLGTLGGGTVAKGIAEDVGTQAGWAGIGNAIKSGALQGAGYGGVFGALQGIAGSNQLSQQAIGAIKQGAAGAALGAGIGGLAGGAGNIAGQVQNYLANVLQQKYGANPTDAVQGVRQFARDELGRFTTGKGPSQEPVYYGDLRRSLGLPVNGQYNKGFIKPDEFLPKAGGGDKGLDPQDIQKYGQDLETPQGKQEIVQQYQKAVQNKPVIDNLLNQTAQVTGARPIDNLKNPDTAVEKVVTKRAEGRDYNPDDLNDVVRGRLVYPDKGELYRGLDVLKQKAQDMGLTVGKESDFFKNPQDGYQGYHVDLTAPNGQTTEVQLHTEKSLAASLATHDFHAQYGDDTMPTALEKQKSALNHEIMSAPNAKAQAITQQIEQKNAPLQAEAQAKAYQTASGNPEPLPWEQEGEQPIPGFNKDLGVQPETKAPPPPQENGTPGVASINPKLVAQQARLARSGVVSSIQFRAQNLAQQMDNVLKTPEDNLNIRLALENPSKIEQYARQSSNPTAFRDLAQKYSDFTDYVAQQAKSSGNPMGYINDYFTHIWDLSTPEAQQTYQDLMAARANNFTSGFTKDRIVNTIEEGLSKGLKLKNPNASQDVMQYANSMGTQLGASAFNQKINELRPGGAQPIGQTPYNYQGRLFKQSNVPGNEGTVIDPEIQKNLSYYNPSVFADSNITKTLDQANRALKTWDLSFGGFHALKTTARQLTLDPTIIPTAIKNAVNPASKLAFNQQAIDDGVIDYGSKVGVTWSGPGDFQGKPVLGGKFNLVENANKSLFSGLINTYKVDAVRNMMSKFDLSDPEQFQQAQKYGAQINDLFGGLNYEAIGRNKTVQQLLRFGVLASDFNEGKVRQIGTAFNPTDFSPAAMFARRTLVGEAVVFGTMAELGRRFVTGQFDTNIKDFITHAILNPSIPLPNSPLFNNNGKTQVAGLPSSDIGDIYRAATNPQQFLQARGAVLPRTASQLKTGLDYYGRPLVPANQDDNYLNRAKALIPANLPIPAVQGLKVSQGKETPADAALNVAGLRVTNNPDDPTVKAQQQYFSALDQAKQGIRNPNDQNIFNGILHPTTKDAQGNLLVDKNTYTNPDKYETLLANPSVLAAEQKFQQSQPNHDPMWDLQPNQLRAFMQAEVISKNNPISGFGSNNPQSQTTKALYATLPQSFFAQRQQWAASLPASTTSSSYTPPPQMPPQVSQFWQQYGQLPYGTGARAQALRSTLGQQALAFINQQQIFTNQQRADMGLPMLTPSSSSSSTGSSTGGGTSAQNYLARQLAYAVSPQKLINQSVRAPLRGITNESRKLSRPIKAKGFKSGSLKAAKRGSSKITTTKAPTIKLANVGRKRLSVANPKRASLKIPKYKA